MEESNGEIFSISKDTAHARNLFEMAKERLNIVIASIPKEVPYKFLEEYLQQKICFLKDS